MKTCYRGFHTSGSYPQSGWLGAGLVSYLNLFHSIFHAKKKKASQKVRGKIRGSLVGKPLEGSSQELVSQLSSPLHDTIRGKAGIEEIMLWANSTIS